MKKMAILCILDGWGWREEVEHNAIAAAHTPQWDALLARYPHGLIDASEQYVGLPDGQMGNSEVGHMNIGGGRVILQDLPRIDAAINDGSLARNPELLRFIASLKTSGGACHLMGLLSDGGVHAHQRHILALARFVAAAGVPVMVHAFLDGRDTAPKSAAGFMQHFLHEISDMPRVRVASIAGRYYAMDRDQRWDRVEKAYHAIVTADAPLFTDPLAAIQQAYGNGQSDEFIVPHVAQDFAGVRSEDGLLMSNFRADRARELLSALLDPGFAGFVRAEFPGFSARLGMVEYSDALTALIPALFPPEKMTDSLGEVVSRAGLKQLRLAETEKYAHVTFFMNGGREQPFDGEERVLIPSPKVATYDLMPEMSAPEVTGRLVEAIQSGEYALIIVNFANPDMVGHSGKFAAAVEAVEAIDRCLGRLHEAAQQADALLMVTADHGNVEQMCDPESGQEHTAHTLNPVPLLMAHNTLVGKADIPIPRGTLADLAPTLLHWLELQHPEAMTGHILLPCSPQQRRS